MNTSKMTEYIKVNFKTPLCTEEMWALVDKETKADYDSDKEGGDYVGMLNNNSLFGEPLVCGYIFHFSMNGKNRPEVRFGF